MSAAGRRRSEYSQHFLRSGALASQLVDLVHLSAADLVIEVGPGTGMLTDRLAERAGAVRAIEIDMRLAALLQERYAGHPSISIIHGDFLRHEIPPGARVVANLPYAITADAVRRVTTSEAADAHLIVQREAAIRFAGSPWGPESATSLLLKPWWHAEIVRGLRRTDFSPPPSVDSVMLWLARREPPLVHGADRKHYEAFVGTAWGHRHTLGESLRRVFTRPQITHLTRELGLHLKGPPSEASFAQWLALFRATQALESGTGEPPHPRR